MSALICGGWPPLGGQYRETLAVTETAAARGQGERFATFYHSLQGWAEREVVSGLSVPRMAFAGSEDEFEADGYKIRISPLLAEHRNELEQMGWTVNLVDGFGHELGSRPETVIPLVREFLDPVLLRQ